MVTPLRSLLFATNLSEECRPALEVAVALATQHQAELVLLYVIVENTPAYIEQELRGALGTEKLEEIKQEYKHDVERTLTGKMSFGGIGEKALQHYCIEAGINLDSCGFNWHNVLVANVNRSEEIINQAEKHGCELIILGTGKAFLGGNAVGSTIKSVLRRSKIPVIVVPSSLES